MPNMYDIGDVVRVSSTFLSTGSVKTDPTSTKFVYTTPDGTDVVNSRSGTSTSSNSIHRTTAGVFYFDVTTTSSGTYWHRFSSTGVVTTSAEWNFRVRKRFTST